MTETASPRLIDPVKDLGSLLLTVEKPARYVGGEYGRLARKGAVLRTLIAFPDLYEIGMSNQALRIIYNRMNSIPGVSCDRAFAPAPDFENLLREKNIPLYGLDTGIPLNDLDILMFTLGYELGLAGILAMLDVSGIPLRAEHRNESHPVVIAGGPAVSNPLPYAPFIDAFWIGEAEAGFFDLAEDLVELKKAGEGRASPARAALLERMAAHPSVWVKGKEKALRAIDGSFSDGLEGPSSGRTVSPKAAVFPVSSMKTVQHHGAVEIMRGCPNGCRFCHAGFWYRPRREKNANTIVEEARTFIEEGGYQEISLSSLSSGDYENLGGLIDELNRRFSGRRVSFQLPSLKVSSFSLSVLEKISQTRKSGLTFAVETPLETWQAAINKEASAASVITILREAKKRGWRGAKFYFMIGLPLAEREEPLSEEKAIVDFIVEVARNTGIHFNINVGIFVPKPHTPFQWAAQISGEAARTKLDYIRAKLKPLGHKVSVSDPVISLIEGILSRGDERAGFLFEEAFRGGSRLDAWTEYINKDKWLELFGKNHALVTELAGKKETSLPLPWQGIGSGVSARYLQNEWKRTNGAECTPPCIENCTDVCGVCKKDIKIIRNKIISLPDNVNLQDNTVNNLEKKSDPAIYRVLFSFSKTGSAVFHGHLSLIEIFSMAFMRAAFPVQYTQGFNSLPKLEIAAPLSLGINAGQEIGAVDFTDTTPPDFAGELNSKLPEGIRVNRFDTFYLPGGSKKHSLSSLLWGFAYVNENNGTEYVKAAEEKQFRQRELEKGIGLFSLRRNAVLARNIIGPKEAADDGQPWAGFFEVYRFLYHHRGC